MKLTRCLPLLFLLAYPLASLAEEAPAVGIRFGVIDLDPATRTKVVKETKLIPFKDCKTGATYGYSVSDKDGRRISTFAVFYPPSPVKKVDEGMWGNAETSHLTGLTTDTSYFTGSGIAEHCFTESDPPGEWSVAIFVHGVRFETLKFRTVD